MNTLPENDVSALIAGQKIATLRRIGEAFDWLYRQDLHDVQRFHLFVEDRFTEKPRISVNLTFTTMEKARYWAAKNLRDIFMPTAHYSGILSYYAQAFTDFTAYCHFPIEQNPDKGV